MALTPKQQRFVEEYLVDLNGTQAAIRAGYSEATANEQASRLLANVNVQEAVQAALEKRSRRVHITQDDVLRELAAMAMARLDDFSTWDDGGVSIKASKDITNTAGIEEIRNTSIIKGSASGGGDEVVLQNEVKLKLTKDKAKALELLGKHLGMFSDRIKLTGADDGPIKVQQMPEIDLKQLSDAEIEQIRQIAIRQALVKPPESV